MMDGLAIKDRESPEEHFQKYLVCVRDNKVETLRLRHAHAETSAERNKELDIDVLIEGEEVDG